MSLTTPPENDEIEVSVFGPGYGESILLHVGENQWFVVDSCECPDTKIPAALKYLRQIGVNPESAVKLIVSTHWHDDHIRGLGAVVRACPDAEFVCSDAINSKDFASLARLYKNAPIPISTGMTEFNSILDILVERYRKTGRRRITWAIANRPLFVTKDPISSVSDLKATVTALSPSDEEKTQSLGDIVRLAASSKVGQLKRITSFRQNHAAVALWIAIGDCAVLLGSDLEETGNPNTGWTAIVASSLKPSGKARFFKIPHHGSETAHHANIWNALVESPNPVAALTPFVNGRTKLPSAADEKRIVSYTINAFISSDAASQRPARRTPKVGKLISQTVRRIRRVNGPLGHIRYRLTHTGSAAQGKVDLFSGARQL